MLTANLGVKNVPGPQHQLPGHPILPVVHAYRAIQYGKHFLPFIHMPMVGLIGPVQSDADAIHVCNVQRTPRTVGGEVTATIMRHRHGETPQ